MTAARSFDATCATHRWPLQANGTCALCERDAASGRLIPPCPHYKTWPRHVLQGVIEGYLLAKTQVGTKDERKQRSLEKMADIVARELGLVHDFLTPPAVALERLIAHFNQLATAGKDD